MIHHLPPSPATVHWGYFDASIIPVLQVRSGDTVVVSTVSGSEAELPPAGAGTVLDAHRAIIENVEPFLGPHIMTGPIAVVDATPGDVLEIRIEAIDLIQDWGFNYTKPGKGVLPDRFSSRHLYHFPIDRERGTASCPWGGELPLSPFFGIMGVAPTPEAGPLSSIEPRAFGGNIDNRELTAGSRLFLPVHAPGALFSVGDGHGCQGDGEVNLTALETALRGRFTLVLHKRAPITLPRAITPTHFIAMAFAPSLDSAAALALEQMIDILDAATDLSPEDAYALCSMACSLRITQMVDGEMGVHAMIERGILPGLDPERFALAGPERRADRDR